MELPKAFDGPSLLSALEKKGLQGGLKTLREEIVVLADWLRSSMVKNDGSMIGKIEEFAAPGVNYFENIALERLDALIAASAPPADPAAADPAPAAAAPATPAS